MGWFEFLTDTAEVLLSQDKTKALNRVSQRRIAQSFMESQKPIQSPKSERKPTMRPMVSVPAGGIRASHFYMRVEQLFVPSSADLLLEVSGRVETGQLHENEWVHFRAPRQTPIILQCVSISGRSIELKANSIADIELIKQYKEKYFSCRICAPDYQDKF